MHMHLLLRLYFSPARSLHVQPSLGPLHDVRLLITVPLRFTSRKIGRTVVKDLPVNHDYLAPGTITAQDHIKVSRVRHGGAHRDRKNRDDAAPAWWDCAGPGTSRGESA